MSWTDWIGPALQIGGKVYEAYNRDQTQQNVTNELARQEQWMYDVGRQNFEAHQDYLRRQYEAQLAGGGGGGGGGAGASMSQYAPYAMYGPGLMKQMAGAYGQGIKSLNTMSEYAFDPIRMERMNTPLSLMDALIDLPDPKGKKK